VRVLGQPVLGQRFLVEIDDGLVRGLERLQIGGGEALGGGRDVGRFHAEVAGAKLGSVELGGVVADGLVAAVTHVGEDGGHGVVISFGTVAPRQKAAISDSKVLEEDWRTRTEGVRLNG
jgi:hypothetical protein